MQTKGDKQNQNDNKLAQPSRVVPIRKEGEQNGKDAGKEKCSPGDKVISVTVPENGPTKNTSLQPPSSLVVIEEEQEEYLINQIIEQSKADATLYQPINETPWAITQSQKKYLTRSQNKINRMQKQWGHTIMDTTMNITMEALVATMNGHNEWPIPIMDQHPTKPLKQWRRNMRDKHQRSAPLQQANAVYDPQSGMYLEYWQSLNTPQ